MSDDLKRRYVDLLLFEAWFHTHWASETDETLQARAKELRKLALDVADPFYRNAVEMIAPDGRRSKDREGRDLVRHIQFVIDDPQWQRDLDAEKEAGGIEQGAARLLAHHIVMQVAVFSFGLKRKLRLAPDMWSPAQRAEIATARGAVASRIAPLLANLDLNADKLAREALEALGCSNKEAHNLVRG